MNRRIFLSAYVLVAACGLAASAKETPTRKADPDPARFAGEIDRFTAWDRQNSAPKDAVLFVGSSSIRMWQTADCFPGLAVINRGFGGSHASDVDHFVPQLVLKYAPRVIVFYAGDNDLADGKSPQQVAGDFEKFVELVRAKLPDAKIIYLPVKPSLNRWAIWPQMQETNALVKEYIDGQPQLKLEYVDTATPMLGSDGRPRPEIFLGDGLHMKPQGYKIWSDLLRGKLGSN